MRAGTNPHSSPSRPGVGSAVGRGHHAKKSLGQNFLIDRNICAKIIDALSPSRGDSILEIGPGRGVLTRPIAESGAALEAVEKDDALWESLTAEFRGLPNVRIIHGDFLDYAFPAPAERYKVVGNIPYNLTARIVSRLVDERERIDFVVLMVQDEVASRLAAQAGTKDYGAISVRLQLVAEVRRLFLVGPNSFRPRPGVNSRVVKITFRNRQAIPHEEEFVSFVKRAFGMRRKMFRHFVSHYYGKECLDALPEGSGTARVETFTPSQIYDLFIQLEKHV